VTAGVLEGAGTVVGKMANAASESEIGQKIGSSIGGLASKIKGSANIGEDFGSEMESMGCGCFTENTKVITKEGLKNIEDVKGGDWVWAYNESNGEKELKKVTETYVLKREGNYTLYIADNILNVSSDHPFYIDQQWIPAAYLQAGDKIQLYSNETNTIDSISYTAGYVTVYNFEVEGNHNYYAGPDGVLVHNPTCVIKFKYPAGASTADKLEFTRQLKLQQRGINKLTRNQLKKNRAAYVKHGRSKAGKAAQRKYRKKHGLGSTQAALHNPDQIAGGGPIPTAHGTTGINSSLGSQWKGNVAQLDAHLQIVPNKFWTQPIGKTGWQFTFKAGP
jgi:hypothetical protein